MTTKQRKFTQPKVSDEQVEQLFKLIKELGKKLRDRFDSLTAYENVLSNHSEYRGEDLIPRQDPEEMVSQELVEPMLTFLGFDFHRQTHLPTPSGLKKPDYEIKPKGQPTPVIYVEAEPINKVRKPGHGLNQAERWLYSKLASSEYAIGTDGIVWALEKFNESSSKVILIDDMQVNLGPLFYAAGRDQSSVSLNNEFRGLLRSFLLFTSQALSLRISGYVVEEEQRREEITGRFYKDYMKYVLGIDENGLKSHATSLIEAVAPPKGVGDRDKPLFATVTMNRLIFVTFLQDRRVVNPNLIPYIFGVHKKNSGAMRSFYHERLKPLFYEVFNREISERTDQIKEDRIYGKLPYLNGGLFRPVTEMEADYDVKDSGIEVVIENILNKYAIGLSGESEIRPEILGYIFEKTMNYITSENQEIKKREGAYYTPDDVVKFILSRTLSHKVLEIAKKTLESLEWRKSDLDGLTSLEDLLENPPRSKKHGIAVLNALEQLTVLDPACGSGHFLRVALSELTRVHASILYAIGETVDLYQLKRKIVTKNLFGVDINETGVEITKLTLWLSIISEFDRDKGSEHVDTLPNIDFNVVRGNTLVGHLREEFVSGHLYAEDDWETIYTSLRELGYDSKFSTEKNRFNPESLIKVFSEVERNYSQTKNGDAERQRINILRLRDMLYSFTNREFLHTLAPRRGWSVIDSSSNLRVPLHWNIEFRDVFQARSGFDVVVGNPPYIEEKDYSKDDVRIVKSQVQVKPVGTRPLYESGDCGNTWAYFVERSMGLLNEEGFFGFIVPLALVSTPRMDEIRSLVMRHSNSVEYYNFDDRPGKIFSGIEDCRSTIVITKKGPGTSRVITSRYHRWYTEDRPRLFTNLRTVEYSPEAPQSVVPKLGSSLEHDILRALRKNANGKTLKHFELDKGCRVWYHNAPRYWIHAHLDEDLPKVEYFSDYTMSTSGKPGLTGKPYKTESTNHYKSLVFDNKYQGFIVSLLVSDLFYWWFTIWSDGRDLLNSHIQQFPFDLGRLDAKSIAQFDELSSRVREEFARHSREKINRRKGGYVIKIREIIPKLSEKIISEISSKICKTVGLTDEQCIFISGFDRAIRLKLEVDSKDGSSLMDTLHEI